MPFFGTASVGYLPRGRVIGLSKIPRVVEMFARRLQVQERMTQQIADFLKHRLNPYGVRVVIEAEHLCLAMRGLQKGGATMVTSSVLGAFRTTKETRDEFMSTWVGPFRESERQRPRFRRVKSVRARVRAVFRSGLVVLTDWQIAQSSLPCAVTCRRCPVHSASVRGVPSPHTRVGQPLRTMKMEGVATMDESKTSTPDKHQPHAFEPTPEVPIVYPRTGTMLQQGLPAGVIGHASSPTCALCGAPRGDRIHLEAEVQADAESPKWGL